jgi:hypothetical protein
MAGSGYERERKQGRGFRGILSLVSADISAGESHMSRTASAERPPQQRSAVTNGRSLFAIAGDGRGAWARRLRDVIELHEGDMGGVSELSQAQRSLVRRAATLTVECERLEARFSDCDAVPSQSDLDLYSRLSGQLRRILESLGIERQSKPAFTVNDYARLVREGS